jgi:hypothetical protein
MNLQRRLYGGVKLALLGAVATATLGYVGYRVFFARTGEAAVGLIPADAQCVVTLDTHPSENQLQAFTKLATALQREGLDKDLESGVSDMIGKAGIAAEVRQYLTHNMATAWWAMDGGAKTHGIALFAISNPEAVSKILSGGTPVQGAGTEAYSFAKNPMVSAVIGGYLAVGTDVETVKRIQDVRNGAASIAGLPAYQQARSGLPADANVMVFGSPSTWKSFMGERAPKTAMWMALGASLRNGGIQFDYRGPVDTKAFPGMAEFSQMKPLRSDLLNKLPPDAYGLVAYSSLDRYFRGIKGSLEQFSSAADVKKGQDGFEKETGLSIEDDILPAFKGDVVVAIYPDGSGSAKSVDGILLIDDANGGAPGALADKLRALIERKSAEQSTKHNGAAVHFIEQKIGAVTVWKLDEASARELQKSAASGGPAGSDSPFANKTIAYAVHDSGTLVIASSDAMMTNAMLALNGSRSLADDPAFADMKSRVGEKDQFMIMCSLSRVAERLRDQFADSFKDSDFTADDMVKLFGGSNVGLVGSCNVRNDTVSGSFFLPLDFDRVAKMIRVAKRPKVGSAMETSSSAAPSPGTMQVR